ncbi:uncharacterized protein [Parasteatoda tepidariorum]|uniref:uncharacterized protein isoform X20 n=1 Tax=Parasteatoda tepidariorum TaxID=114398 RepID=UPI0039BC638E
MTQFVSHIPVDVMVTRPVRPHHIDIKDHHHRQSDTNASFLRAARAANLEKVLEYLKGNIDINTSNVNGLNALHLASKEGHVNLVQELVKRGANVNAATKKGNTALHIASLAGKEDVAKILIRHGANPNAQSQNGFTPLYMAAQENHDGVVKLLLANGANQSLATEDGFTPLAVALQQGHDKVVAVLLENDAKGRVRLPALHIAAKKDDCKAAALLLQSDHDPDVTSKSGFTPLHIAAHYGNENIAALLLEKNADVNYSAKHQITPLHVAAKWGKSNMVTLLIDKGAKIDASTRDGLTPLHCAARSGHDQVVDLLLEKGAPITAKTKNGLAPLHMASQGDHVDSARILLYHKAPVDDVTVDYLTALHVAAHCGHVRVAKLLLDRKADPNSRALNGFTPLHIACKKNRIKVVELLLKHGASIEATTESGLTPLHVASFMGCMNIVIFLITNGANPDVPTVRGETPLHLAARANQSDIIRILLRNGAHVDASAREQQTPLHIAARLGNVDIVGLLLQHGAAVDAPTKDMYTALHIAAKEGQEEVASVLLDHAASLTSTTKKGFTPLHLAAKYGNIKVARLLLQKDAPVDAQGKNGVTPLHVAAHYDHVNVALLLLDKGAFPHATAKNGYTPLHIAAKKNQMDIATTLLEYGAKPSAESKAGFTPLHLAAQEGHTDMTTLLIEHHADVNAPAKNGLTPLHLCAQEDKVNVAAVLVKNGAKVDPPTKAGYTPLHVACHFGQINMIRFLLQHGADVNSTTSHGYTPLHQAAQQGHTLIINLLLEHKASPNTTTNQGQTALSIAQRLGYISVVETLKIVTETVVTTTTTTITEEKYKVVAPETMQETFMSDSEDEGADDTMMGDQSLHYMTTDELKALADDNTLGIDVTRDERGADSTLIAPLTAEEDHLTPQHVAHQEATFSSSMASDNVDLARAPVHAGFLVSFMVDARGGAMRGCRHSGVRVIIPPRKAPMPMRITCRYLRKEKLAYPPPLMEGEACASRILEVGPSGAKFLGPVIIEVPHFASLRGREREITILRSDNGESWREHTLEASDDAVHDVFNESFEGEELTAIEDLSTNRITRILTTDFPQYFAIITRIRQEVHAIGPEGGMVSSTVVPQVQAIFPEGALTKKIKVGLQAHPISPELVTKLLGNRVAVSPIVTVEPRRRKFHKSITLTIPVPQAATKGMINQYSGDAPTLRLLCSITGGTTKAQWEDVTGSTPLTFVNDCVSFTTTVSARFWLMDCRQVNEATKFATELYREAIHVPFMAKFVVFAKRRDPLEAQLRVFCMTDDKEDKTLESQEHFTEVAKSRDVEVLEGKLQYLEFAGNLVPVTKSGEQLSFTFQAFRENRLPFTIRVKDTHQEPMGRVAFMREARVGRGEAPQAPICNLNIVLPDPDLTPVSELVTLEKKYGFVQETSLAKPELIHRADLRLSDIAKELGNDWVPLALQLDVPEAEINSIRCDHPGDNTQQALAMLRHWLQRTGSKANGNLLEKGLRKINREDIVNHCIFNVELVTDDVEKAVAKVHLDQSGFDTFKEELGSSRDASLRRDTSLNGTFDEQDIMKDAESAAETSSESSDKDALFRSDSRHAETRAERRHHRHSGRSFEDGPETLVQTVPTTMSESFTQHLTNGQMSDTSMHEEDRSEQTAATFSSEANAEMEASSFEDKSQGETHVDKKAYGRHPDFKKYVYKTSSDPFSNYKAFKSRKTISICMNKRVMASDASSWSMTAPSSSRKRKIVTRRKSWPPDAPHKLNVRKKYQNLKLKDAFEPFWTDTYEWAIMQRGPESIRPAPLARLAEFTIYEKYKVKPYKPNAQANSYQACDNSQSVKLKAVDVIGFYFTKKEPLKAYSQKNYLTNLKKMCAADNKNCAVRELNQTNFISDENSVKNIPSKTIKSEVSKNTTVLATNRNASVKFENKEVLNQSLSNNLSHEFGFNDRTYVSHPENTSFGTPSVRQLHSFNSDLSGNVAVERPVIYLDDDILNIKNKFISKGVVWNKENIKFENFSDSKMSNIGEKCKPHTCTEVAVKNQQIQKSFKPQSKKVKLTAIDWPEFDRPEIKFNKSFKNKIKGSPLGFESKAPQDMDTDSKSSGKVSKTGKDSSSQSSSSSNPSTSQEVPTSTSSQTPSNQNNNNKPYLRQLFEHDIQSNFESLNKDKEFDKDVKKPDPKKKETESEKSSTSSSTIPANVVGFDFLTTLQKRTDIGESSGEKFPASVIGQAFLDNLADQKDKYHGSSSEAKAVPSSVVGLSFLKSLVETVTSSESDEQPLPASVIGQSFLKNLLESQSNMKADNSKSQQVQESENPPSEQTIPSSVIGQAFLKTLVDTQQHVEKRETPKPIPSEVLGQTFLKSLLVGSKDTNETTISKVAVSPEKQSSSSSVPATVIGQSFLKNLLEQSAVAENPNIHYAHPVTVVDETVAKDNPKPAIDITSKPLPAAVIGQSFLSTLLRETEIESSGEKNVIPAPVIGQSFLKNLLESETCSKPSDEGTKEIPAPVIGQAFLKSLIESQTLQQLETGEKSSDTTKTVPATVIGQSFLKNLLESESCSKPSDESTKEIPAPVIGQAFLKSLIESQTSHQPETGKKPADSSKTVPSTVIGQSFLKTLIQEEPAQESKNDVPIPASVIGLAFLKTLSADPTPASQSQSIPAPVIGQTFLKSLLQQPSSDETQEKTIPASVLGQSFLKTLIGKETTISKTDKNYGVCESAKDETQSTNIPSIPSSVVGQTFLQSLIAEESKMSEKTESIPSQVVGQAFLKTLLEATPASKEVVDKPIPANVLGQVFLKSLAGEGSKSLDLSSSDQTVTSKDGKKETVIPSQVLGQAFLKTLTSEAENVVQPEPETQASIPASVIGLAFLKTLTDQSEETPISQSQSTKKSMPAGVVGQAFLKTLVDFSDDSTSLSTDSSLQISKKDESVGNGFHAGSVDNGMDMQSSIIPPPPEFGSSDEVCSFSSNIPGTSGNVDVTPGIIDELLSYTKMMHSVIESMQESEDPQGTSSENQKKKK